MSLDDKALICFILIVAPKITEPMERLQLNIIEGHNASVICTATGYPVPKVVWQNSDGSSLSNNRLVSGSPVMSSTSIGNLRSVSVELMVIAALRVITGVYICLATNAINSTTRNIIITIEGKMQCRICIFKLYIF